MRAAWNTRKPPVNAQSEKVKGVGGTIPGENIGEVIRAVNHAISEISIHKGTDDERDPDNASENREILLTIQ
jgi:hypothetical protein